MNLIPGKLYRANTGIWALYYSNHKSVFVDGEEILLLVDKPDERWCEFLNKNGLVIILGRKKLGSLIGPL